MANEFREIGRDIRNAVLNAVDSGDFSQLNSQITRSVSDAIAEVNSRLQAHGRGGWAPDYRYSPSQNPDPIFSHPPMKKASAACDRQTCFIPSEPKGMSPALSAPFSAPYCSEALESDWRLRSWHLVFAALLAWDFFSPAGFWGLSPWAALSCSLPALC